MKNLKTLAIVLALVCLLTSPSFGKEKKQSLLESAREAVQKVTNGVAVAEGVGNMLGGGDEPRAVPTPDGGSMPNPRTMNLLIGQAVDLRDLSQTIQSWTDEYTGITYRVITIQRSLLNERVTSDFHAAFVKEGAWNTIGKASSDTADRVVQDYTRNKRVNQSTIQGLLKPNLLGPQSLIIPEITFCAIEQAVQGNFVRRAKFEYVKATIILNVFMVDLETGKTRTVAEGVEGTDHGFLASGIWSLFLKNGGLTYVQQLTTKASKQAAHKAARFMSQNDSGPVRWIDGDPRERIKNNVLNGSAYKAVGGDNPVGDLVEVGERTWTLKFSDIRGIKNRDQFEIWSATKLGLPDAPTGVFVSVDFIDMEKKLVGAHVSKIDPRTAGILPQTAPDEMGPRNVRPSAQKPVEPQVSFAEKFAQARPGSLLPFEGEKPGEEFFGFLAQVADCMPAQGEKKTAWLERGTVVLVVNPAKGSKDQPVKGLVGDIKEESGEWIVWVLGGADTANATSEKVAWDGWRIYPYNPTQSNGR